MDMYDAIKVLYLLIVLNNRTRCLLRRPFRTLCWKGDKLVVVQLWDNVICFLLSGVDVMQSYLCNLDAHFFYGVIVKRYATRPHGAHIALASDIARVIFEKLEDTVVTVDCH